MLARKNWKALGLTRAKYDTPRVNHCLPEKRRCSRSTCRAVGPGRVPQFEALFKFHEGEGFRKRTFEGIGFWEALRLNGYSVGFRMA